MSQIVIIIGAARSGTKYLRDVLATAPNAARVPYDINYIWRYGSESHPDDALPASLVALHPYTGSPAGRHRATRIDCDLRENGRVDPAHSVCRRRLSGSQVHPSRARWTRCDRKRNASVAGADELAPSVRESARFAAAESRLCLLVRHELCQGAALRAWRGSYLGPALSRDRPGRGSRP